MFVGRRYIFQSCTDMCLIKTHHPGSPSLPDKAKHNREVMILLPSHRERAGNSMYYNMAENGQVRQICRALTSNRFADMYSDI